MLQILQRALAHKKVSFTSDSLLKEIRQVVFFRIK